MDLKETSPGSLGREMIGAKDDLNRTVEQEDGNSKMSVEETGLTDPNWKSGINKVDQNIKLVNCRDPSC